MSENLEDNPNIEIPEALIDTNKEFVLLSGKAGTGKSTLIKEVFKRYPNWGISTATTGIAACNSGGITIHSLLGTFDTDSWIDAHKVQKLQKVLLKIAEYSGIGITDSDGVKTITIVIDEVFMLNSIIFDILVTEVAIFNSTHGLYKYRLVMVGDPGQLPPVKKTGEKFIKPIFEADNWEDIYHIKLEKVHRQANADFVGALECLRQGEALEALEYFRDKIGLHKEVDRQHPGVVVYATNPEVDLENKERFEKVPGALTRYYKSVIGRERPEWKSHIPDILSLKVGVPVMVLVNQRNEGYANGDLGIVEGLYSDSVLVRLNRRAGEANSLVEVGYYTNKDIDNNSVTYMPLRLAYASTGHKLQSLTVPWLQMVLGHRHTRSCHGLGYTMATRVRTPEGLRVVVKPLPGEPLEVAFVKSFLTQKDYKRWM